MLFKCLLLFCHWRCKLAHKLMTIEEQLMKEKSSVNSRTCRCSNDIRQQKSLSSLKLRNGSKLAINFEDLRYGEDDDLTNLTWLQDTNLLKNIHIESSEKETLPERKQITKTSIKQDNYSHVQYDPLIHVNAKPPYSFSCLIFMAIENSSSKALPVKDIYSWILSNFPYFQQAPNGWKNSVRHNLSLNKCFHKIEKKGQNLAKGSLWCIDPAFRPNLIQALQKGSRYSSKDIHELSLYHNSYAPRPFVSGYHLTWQRRNSALLTTNPIEDHTYSACFNQLGDELHISDDDSFHNVDEETSTTHKRRKEVTDEESQKQREGAHALLNLAKVATVRQQLLRLTEAIPVEL